LANIISIGTALPEYCHPQQEILKFMQQAYNLGEVDKRKLSFLYGHSGIGQRYSVIEDFSKAAGDWTFIPNEKNAAFPSLEKRLALYQQYALPISLNAINNCIDGFISAKEITHLITVSCTGMSAPGLDLQIAEALDLSPDLFRTSVNFMGCYASIHAMKIAKMICDSTTDANVIIVSTELCTLHFQKEFTIDSAASSLLFSDGSAAILVSNTNVNTRPLSLKNFYSLVSLKGKNDMAWEINSKGFLMKLSSYIPQLIQEDISKLVETSLQKAGLKQEEITHWCIHPGGKKILDVIQKQLQLTDEDLKFSTDILSKFGNMSSTTILFVLKEMMATIKEKDAVIFGVAFGPGLTMETFIASNK
jgi:predicted naringenin-chalcone synthase